MKKTVCYQFFYRIPLFSQGAIVVFIVAFARSHSNIAGIFKHCHGKHYFKDNRVLCMGSNLLIGILVEFITMRLLASVFVSSLPLPASHDSNSSVTLSVARILFTDFCVMSAHNRKCQV